MRPKNGGEDIPVLTACDYYAQISSTCQGMPLAALFPCSFYAYFYMTQNPYISMKLTMIVTAWALVAPPKGASVPSGKPLMMPRSTDQIMASRA